MRTEYSNNTRGLKVLLALYIISSILAAFFSLFYLRFHGSLGSIIPLLILISTFLGWSYNYRTLKIIIDEEMDTIVVNKNKNYPLSISEIATIACQEKRRNRCLLNIHDNKTGFISVLTSKENAEKIVTQLTSIKPSIKVER